MKLFTEYSVPELANLNREELESIIQLECAREGIQFIEEPKLPAKPAYDDFYFEIEHTGIKSRDEAMINVLCDAIKESSYGFQDSDYEWEMGYEFQFLKEDYSNKFYKVVKVGCFKEATVKHRSQELIEYQQQKSLYDTKRSQWLNSGKSYNRIKEKIIGGWISARNKIQTQKELQSSYEFYKKLFDGDEAAADKFFENTFPGQLQALRG